MVSYAPSLLNFRGPLIRALRARGVAVTALAPDFDESLRATLADWGVTCRDVPLSRRGVSPREDMATLRALTATMREIRPDLLVTFTIKPNIWGAFAARRARVPVLTCVTGLGYAFSSEGGPPKARAIRALGRALYGRAMGYAARVVFQNPDDRDDFIAAGCLHDASKARMVNGSGVDMAYFVPTALPEVPVFLMISRLMGGKGVREYAQAAMALKARRPELTFRLVGPEDAGLDGISLQEVEGWVAGGLDYRGPASDVRPEITEASIYVLPSYREGTPRSVLEAMAMGRAIITTDAPGCRETVVDGESGLLVPVRDVPALTAAMERLADDAALRTRLAAAALARAQVKYDVEVVNAQMMGHMTELFE